MTTKTNENNFSNNHIQIRVGFIIVLLYALYGSYTSSLYILAGDRGGIRSADFYIFVVVFLLLTFSNLGNKLINKFEKNTTKPFLLIFILYIFFKILFDINEVSIVKIGTLIKDIGMNFLIGFIAFSLLKSRLPVFSGLVANFQKSKWLRRITFICTIIFIGLNIYFLSMFFGISIKNIISDFQINSISNDYYQDFGDYMTLAYCCMISIQVLFLKNCKNHNFSHLIFFVVITLETFISFICLQSVMSNKSVAVIVPVFLLTIYYTLLKGWLFNRNRFTINTFFSIILVLIVILLLGSYMPEFDYTKLRIFDNGESSSILTNSSVLSRITIIQNSFMQQFLNAPMFGDISYTQYMHSSLLSIQTHLGIIGSILFWTFIVSQMLKLYRMPGNEILKAIALPILFVSIISSFFTWGPLWFLIGALYEFTPQLKGKDVKYAA